MHKNRVCSHAQSGVGPVIPERSRSCRHCFGFAAAPACGQGGTAGGAVNGDRGLRARRTAMYRLWAKFMSGESVAGVREDVLSSWRRTRKVLSPDIAGAPSGQTGLNHESLLASTSVVDGAMRSTLRASEVVVGIVDPRGQMVWTNGEPRLLRRGEKFNYKPGALWDEASVGVNAMSLALASARPSTVWSAEHWCPA